MSINASAIRAMRASGLSDTQILDVIEKADEDRRAKAAEKKRRQRAAVPHVPDVPHVPSVSGTSGTNGDKQAAPRARVVNTTLPSEEVSNTLPSEGTGKPVSDSPKARLWSEAVPALIALGVPDRQARGVIGGWLKSSSPEAVLHAVRSARRECPMAPVPWITAALRPPQRAGPSRFKPSITDTILDLLAEERAQ